MKGLPSSATSGILEPFINERGMADGEPLDTTPERSALMKRVRQKGTTPESLVRKALSSTGARYRLNVTELPGSPDIANIRKKKAIFVHGCFWHHHEACGRGRFPKRNREFWEDKLRRNVERDRRKAKDLADLGFDVLVLWECELKDSGALRHRLRKYWFGHS
jgi:DNA mismatch endonuclease, patch repair protein